MKQCTLLHDYSIQHPAGSNLPSEDAHSWSEAVRSALAQRFRRQRSTGGIQVTNNGQGGELGVRTCELRDEMVLPECE